MHQIIKAVGIAAIAAGILIVLIGVGLIFSGDPNFTLADILWIGFSTILSGAVLYCFGAIVEHLIAIRLATEQQLKIFERLKSKGA
jgi:hypothetical protein